MRTSRGHLAIRSTDPFDQPRIEPNYFAEELDRKTMVAGLQILRNIYRQESFRDLWDIKMVGSRPPFPTLPRSTATPRPKSSIFPRAVPTRRSSRRTASRCHAMSSCAECIRATSGPIA